MSKDKKDNDRLKYESILSLKSSEGEIQWNRYNAMLVVNTILFGFVGLRYNKDFVFPILYKILLALIPFFGLFLCKVWYTMTERGFEWTQFWMNAAYILEKNISGSVNPVIEGKAKRDEMGVGATKKYSLAIINVFAFIYFFIFVNNLTDFLTISSEIYFWSVVRLHNYFDWKFVKLTFVSNNVLSINLNEWSTIFNNLSVGIAALAGIIFGWFQLKPLLSAAAKKNADYWMKKYPKKDFEKTFRLIESEKRKGKIYLLDLKENTKHHIGSNPTRYDINMDDLEVDTLTKKQFDSFNEGERILTQGKPGD